VKKSGYLNVDKGNSNSSLFYTFYGVRGETSLANLTESPIVIWMNGGPGASGQIGNFFELGPYKLENGKEVVREGSWNENYNLLVIDQPIGTGASYA